MKLRPFELGLVIFFGVAALLALVVLRVYSPSGSEETPENYVGPVQIWGTLPAAPMNTFLNALQDESELYDGVSYTFKSPERFNQELIEALADGVGPDLILVSHEELAEQRRRIQPVSYENWSVGEFRDMYLDGADLYALSDGIYGTPLLVNPLMLYWNRDILSNAGFLTPPATWEELVNVQLPALVERTFDRTITRSVVAMGTYDNVRNGVGMLSTLLLQSGSQFVSDSATGGSVEYSVNLSQASEGMQNPFTTSLSFFLRFAQPANTLYTWNRSFSSDRNEFISEDLVFYFGYANEGRQLEDLNPNLSFDIAEIPQGQSADMRRTYGEFYALSPLRTADNLTGAFRMIGVFSDDTNLQTIADAVNMVPAKRSLVANGSRDLYLRVAYLSAPITYGWLMPSRAGVDSVFSEMVREVNENRSSVGQAVGTAQEKIRRLYE